MEQSVILKQSLKDSLILNHSNLGLNAHKQLSFNQKIDHLFCGCIHCVNNTKPIQHQFYPRITSTLQYELNPVRAYNFIVGKMINYPGRALLPQMYLIENQNPSLIWYNSAQEKIKMKQGVSAMDVKKHFDSQKQKYLKAIKNRNLSTAFFGMSLAQSYNSKSIRTSTNNQNHLSLNMTNNPSWASMKKNHTPSEIKQMKEVAVINYTNCFSQIVTDPLLTKYFAKRKNDNFWLQISSIVLIPPYKEKQLTFHEFNYYRNSKVLDNLQKIMKIMAKIVDQQKQNSVNPEAQTNLQNSQNIQEKELNQNQKKQDKNSAKQILKSFFKGFSLSQIPISQKKQKQDNPLTTDQKKIQSISYELIAYLEIMFHVRILEVKLKYIIDYDENCYLMDIDKFIAAPLKDTEKFMVHDRFKPLDQVYLDDITNFKISLNCKEEEEFKVNLAQLVADCLEKRKTQLKNCVYHRPSKQKLMQIFQRIFPNFRQNQFFKNSNWRNQIQPQLQNFRYQISKIIRQDQGIRILKRFGIQFYRTWN